MIIGLIVGLIFTPFAVASAFIITYEEYKRHYPDKKRPLKQAKDAAIFTFIFFVLLSAFIGIVLNTMIK